MKEFVESLLLLYREGIIGKDTICILLWHYLVYKQGLSPDMEIKYTGQKGNV